MKTTPKTQQHWEDHINAWRLSGLTQAAYCEQHSLNLNQLIYQKSKHDGKRQHQPNAKPSTSAFASVAVTPSSRSEGLTLRLASGVQLSGIDAANLVVTKAVIELLS